jgi:carboxypeptidase D
VRDQLTCADPSIEYVVNGTALPDVDFDIGESYAGLMPIHKDDPDFGELYFWFFPTDNEDGKDEITIWLNVRAARC